MKFTDFWEHAAIDDGARRKFLHHKPSNQPSLVRCSDQIESSRGFPAVMHHDSTTRTRDSTETSISYTYGLFLAEIASAAPPAVLSRNTIMLLQNIGPFGPPIRTPSEPFPPRSQIRCYAREMT